MSTPRLRALVAAAALSALPLLAFAGGGTATAGALPQVAASDEPTGQPDPTREPSSPPNAAPSPSATMLPLPLPSRTSAPTPEATVEPTGQPTRAASAEPTSTRTAKATATRSATPRPQTTTLVSAAPATGVTEQPGATLVPATEGPSPTPAAAVQKEGPGDPVTRLIGYVVLGGVLLGAAGAGGLYLTRHPRSTG